MKFSQTLSAAIILATHAAAHAINSTLPTHSWTLTYPKHKFSSLTSYAGAPISATITTTPTPTPTSSHISSTPHSTSHPGPSFPWTKQLPRAHDHYCSRVGSHPTEWQPCNEHPNSLDFGFNPSTHRMKTPPYGTRTRSLRDVVVETLPPWTGSSAVWGMVTMGQGGRDTAVETSTGVGESSSRFSMHFHFPEWRSGKESSYGTNTAVGSRPVETPRGAKTTLETAVSQSDVSSKD
ncbi:hypothetical protein BU23DRAFT_564188 [Bimuria novae-zelandiae CBS 107.79]|uniref:Uncharacterized protein n=1 Tax=Bimuria novae-zelandiae CBS 107.79 TaxID=1447943 RepID=A0A6A5VMT0_9PLEO|nr:hypothetical protein BU23DRAFT_564188 [Bimuria novae-zelandiae CBS 107.79]